MNNIIASFTPQRSRLPQERIQKLTADILPKYLISSFADIAEYKNVHLEIGSGFGDTVVHLASTKPDAIFIACEVFIDGISSMCKKIEELNLSNIRIYKKDARLLLDTIPKDFLEHVYLLFPDPWPKQRHRKRRIFNTEFLIQVNNILKPQGKITVATDHDSYKEQILKVINAQKNFTITDGDLAKEPIWWKKTKYQNKAEVSGRKSIFITLQKAT